MVNVLNKNKNLKETLSFYEVQCNESYYVSSGSPIYRFPSQSFRMNFFNICLCMEGEVLVEINNQKYCIQHNSILVSTPNTSVRFIEQSKDFRFKLLFFEKDFLLKNISNPFIIEKSPLFKNNPYNIITLTPEKTNELFGIMSYLQQRTAKSSNFTSEISRTIIFNLLLEIAEVVDIENENTHQPKSVYYRFYELLHHHIFEEKSVQFYADALCVSNARFIEIIKHASGKTPHQLIDEHLLKEAISLLGNPDLQISEVAFKLNFSSVSSFGRFFKKQTQLSPLQYRKSHNIM